MQELRTSRRAAGPSGMTAEHLRVLLHCPVATLAFIEVATALARADVPDQVGQVDSASHRGGRHCSQVGWAHPGTTILQASGGCHVPFSACSFH